MREIRITSWKELVSLPKGTKLIERNTKFGNTNIYFIGHVTMKRDMVEVFYEHRNDHFQIEEAHFTSVLSDGDSTLHHVTENHFDEDMFKL